MPPRKVEGKPRKKKEGDLKDIHALFSFDAATARKLDELVARTGKKKSALVREAIAGFHSGFEFNDEVNLEDEL